MGRTFIGTCGLGLPVHERCWGGDFARVSAAQTPSLARTNKTESVHKPCGASQISDRSILSRTDHCGQDFVTRFHRPWCEQLGCCLLPRRADQPQPCPADAASDRAMATATSRRRKRAMMMPSSILGRSIQQGVGRPRSDQEAFRWFSRATDQGHSHAMLIVAGLYASGRGITKDNVKAYSWAYIVASAGKVDEDRNGARQLMSLMKRMTSDEIGRAVVAARAWRAVRCWCGQVSAYRKSWRRGPARAAAPPPPRTRGRAVSAAAAAVVCGRRSRRHPPSRYCRHPPRSRRHRQ